MTRVGIDVHHVVDGPAAGPVVVFSNSLGSDLRVWRPQVRTLVELGFRVVRYDTRGHGSSPVPPGPYRLDDLGADVLRLLDRLDVDTAHVVGLSLGGMTGIWLGVHASRRVSSLTLCCTSARPGNPAMWQERAVTARQDGMAAIADAAVLRWLTEGWRRRHPDETRELRDMIAATPAEGYASCCEVLAGLDLTEDLPRIDVPTLVVSAAADAALPPEHGAAIADRVPGARFEVVLAAAHAGSYEQPQRVNQLITEHVRGET